MKKRRQLLAALLALVMAAALLAGCGGGTTQSTTQSAGQSAGQSAPAQEGDTFVITNRSAQNPVQGTPEKPLNAAEVYRTLTYIPEMFYGQYLLPGGDAALERYQQSVSFMTYNAEHQYHYDRAPAEEREMTAIPYQISAGPGNLYTHDPETRIPRYYWMKAYFLQKSGDKAYPQELFFAYDVEGNTLRMRMLKNVVLDEETNEVASYEFGDLFLTYQFEFRGTSLTLSYNGESVTLETARVGETKEQIWMAFSGQILPGEKELDQINYMSFNYDERDGHTSVTYLFDGGQTDAMSRESVATISKDGLITFTIPYPEGAKTYQFVYFYLSNDGFILTDGTEVYFYHSWYGDYYAEKLTDVLGEGVDPRGLSKDQADVLMEKQSAVIDDLSSSFEENGLSVDLNRETGRVTLDSSVLFDSDSAELSDEGKAFLERFARAYADGIITKGHTQDVKQILIEGHTDSDGSYEYNQELSERRAKVVAEYCISLCPELEPYLAIKGCAYDEPVLRSDGTEDKDASRRVVFKFILNVD